MTTHCTNVECPSPAVRWDGRTGAWVHRDSGLRSCQAARGLLMPPFVQQKTRLPGQLFWHCPTCGTWVTVQKLRGTDDLYARCYGPASARHDPTRWVSVEGLEPPEDTPPLPEQRNGIHEVLLAAEEDSWEYGIEYHYSPERWHVLPNVTFANREDAERELAKRRRGFGEGGRKAYRLLKRRAAGPWSTVGG